MKYGVRYEESVINESTSNLDAKFCTSITFENYGNDNAIINRGIKLNSGTSLTFDNLPNEIILSSFKIQFAGIGANPEILVIRKFVEPYNK